MSEHSDHEVLRRRARQLATPPRAAAATDRFDTLGYVWAGVTYLVMGTHVRETVRMAAAAGVSAVPGARLPLLGMVTVRGEALPVIDPRHLLDLPTAPHAPSVVVVLEHGGRPSLGLAAEKLLRLVTVHEHELQAPADGSPIVRALTADGAALLDTDALLDLPPFFRTTEGTTP